MAIKIPREFTIGGQFVRQYDLNRNDETAIRFHKNDACIADYEWLFADGFIPQSIFELGVKEGGSLLLWKKLFPKCKIGGIDCNKPKANLSEFTFLILNLFNAHLIKQMQYDVIIDDCQHTIETMTYGFKIFWPQCMKYYIVEDWQALHPTHQVEVKNFITGFSGKPIEQRETMWIVRR